MTITEQVSFLFSKGLIANECELSFCLSNVSYHRLSGYWEPFKNRDDELEDWKFLPETCFDEIWDRYVFDRQLRLLVLDAIERIEVAIRDDVVLGLAVPHGPFGYLDASNLPNIQATDNSGKVVYTHKDLLTRARALFRREANNGNAAVKAFAIKYGNDHQEYLPYWMLMEIVEFGTLCRIYWGAPVNIRKTIAQKYDIRTADVLDSWMSTFRSARNNSAHHGKFWDGRYRVKPILPNRKNPEWHEPVEMETVKDTAFGTLTLLKYMLGYIAPQSKWAERLEALFAKHPGVDRRLLGYPENWQDCPFWRTDERQGSASDGQTTRAGFGSNYVIRQTSHFDEWVEQQQKEDM
jgi:abortive infection bacteriophage resistance protein